MNNMIDAHWLLASLFEEILAHRKDYEISHDASQLVAAKKLEHVVDIIETDGMFDHRNGVDLVRCNECKFSENGNCGYVKWYNNKNDFCSRGNRKDG